MLKVINITIHAVGERVNVICPNCSYINNYAVMPSPKFEAIRPCLKCEAIIKFECEEEK